MKPVPFWVARLLLEQYHYLHSFPGGTKLAFGVFGGAKLLGAMTLGSGPANAHALVEGANPEDCLVLTRLWLSDELPKNSESRVLGIVLRSLRKNTDLKFLVSYSDPAQGHVGTIYQATGWVYTGLSQATPRYDIGDGRLYHSRSLSHRFGYRGKTDLERHGIQARPVPQQAKHRYVIFLDPCWRSRLKAQQRPYPKPDKPIKQ